MNDSKPEQIHQLFAEHHNAGNVDALVDLYDEHAAYVSQTGQVINGKNAIRDALGGLLTLKGKLSFETRYAIQSGNVALLSAKWHLHGVGPDGAVVEMRGQTAEVVQLQSDGRWLFVVDQPFNSD